MARAGLAALDLESGEADRMPVRVEGRGRYAFETLWYVEQELRFGCDLATQAEAQHECDRCGQQLGQSRIERSPSLDFEGDSRLRWF
jgi:hypothetical protein